MEVPCELLEACRDTPVVLELVEEALDAVAQFVSIFVVGDLGLSRSVWRNDDIDLGVGKEDAELIGVVAFVRNDTDQRQTVDEVGSLGRLVHLPRREKQPKRIAEGVDGRVDLGAQSPARAADGLSIGPPFAPLACW